MGQFQLAAATPAEHNVRQGGTSYVGATAEDAADLIAVLNVQQAELLVGLYQAGEFVRDLLATQLPLGTRELLLSHDTIDDKGQLTGLGVAVARQLAFAANRGPDPHLVATAEAMEAALNGWDVVAPGSSRSSAHTDTQAQAINRAREIVTNLGGGEVVIHRPDGTIRDSDTVGGNDPHPPTDRK